MNNIYWPPGITKPGVFIEENPIPKLRQEPRPAVVVAGIREPVLCMSYEEAVNALGEEAHVVRWYFETQLAIRGLWLVPHPDFKG